MDGTVTLTLTFDEYRAVAAALLTAGDTVVLGLFDVPNEVHGVANEFLARVTDVISKLTAARDAAGWAQPAAASTN